MGGMRISELDFLRLLPAFMRDDEAVIALSKAMNTLLGEPGKRLQTLRTWDKIDDLTEAECDELAWELDIDWYDSTGMSLEKKREAIKLAQQIKRKRGTKWAVEELIRAYFGEGYVAEWYEIDGSPYTFVVMTTSTHVSAENYNKFVEAANAAKNERSHIAGIYYYWPQGPDPGVECAMGAKVHRYNFEECGTHYRTTTIGLVVKSGIETEPEETLQTYDIREAGESTCGTYPQQGTRGVVQKAAAAVEPKTEHALYSFPECGVNVFTIKQSGNLAIVDIAVVDEAVVC